MSDSYKEFLRQQRSNVEKSSVLRAYFHSVYSQIATQISGLQRVLEVGAGAGISGIFLDQKILRTDYFPFPEFDVLGNCPAENLPFEDSHFEALFLVDALHHVTNLEMSFNEFIRVVSPGGKIVIFEPWVSFLSYFPYKLFHHESTSWKLNQTWRYTSNDPSDGNQGVSRFIVNNKEFSNRFKGDLKTSQITYMSPFSFYLTGGVSKPSQFSERFLNRIIKFESKIPQIFLKLTAARVLITMNVI